MIEDLEKKLNGELPIRRWELIELIDSWGKVGNLSAYIEVGECYDLSKLDTSQITNFDDLFLFSSFDGDISNWNTSNVTSMRKTFYCAEIFNQPLPWNTINVTSAVGMFRRAESFEHPINFDVSNLHDYASMLDSDAFIKKFNDGKYIENPKGWIEKNRDKMNILSISEDEKNELDSLFNGIEDELNNNPNQHRANKQSL